jgi:CubicO group peptidase (beta-lactamase class C family)
MEMMKKKALILLTIVLVLISNQGRAQSISDLIDGYFAYNRFWGNVLVVQNGKIIFQKSYGFADKERNIKNESATLFYLASVTKTVTATAIFRLHEEGKLSVYDRVDKYVPGFINDKTDSLTILNLLNHTSGMVANISHSDDFSKEVTTHPDKEIVSLEQLIDSYRDTKLKSKPGVRYDYNNYGYLLLAYIIEKASGMDYMSYLRNAIFPEAGMTETTDQKNLPRQPAVGYFGIGTGNIIPVKYEVNPSWLIGATGLYSSTQDLSKFVRAVFSCRMFSRQTLDLMIDTCINIHKENIFWTAGWQKEEIDGHNFYSHGGSKEGFSTLAGYIPDDDISIIILSNLVRDFTGGGLRSVNFSFVDDITSDIIRIIHGKSVACLPVPKGKASRNPAGNYKLDDNHYMNVYFQHDSLFLSADPTSNFTLFDYNLYREINDSTSNYKVCKRFTSSILENNSDGFGLYATEEMQHAFFNEKGFISLMNFWGKVISHDGQYLSSNICEKVVKPYGADYKLVYHFERSELIMQISFNEQGLINGFYILKVLPKCNVKTVNLIPVNKDEYFVDGFMYGGFKDFNVKYDRICRTLNFKNDDGTYTALRTDNQ